MKWATIKDEFGEELVSGLYRIKEWPSDSSLYRLSRASEHISTFDTAKDAQDVAAYIEKRRAR